MATSTTTAPTMSTNTTTTTTTPTANDATAPTQGAANTSATEMTMQAYLQSMHTTVNQLVHEIAGMHNAVALHTQGQTTINSRLDALDHGGARPRVTATSQNLPPPPPPPTEPSRLARSPAVYTNPLRTAPQQNRDDASEASIMPTRTEWLRFKLEPYSAKSGSIRWNDFREKFEMCCQCNGVGDDECLFLLKFYVKDLGKTHYESILRSSDAITYADFKTKMTQMAKTIQTPDQVALCSSVL